MKEKMETLKQIDFDKLDPEKFKDFAIELDKKIRLLGLLTIFEFFGCKIHEINEKEDKLKFKDLMIQVSLLSSFLIAFQKDVGGFYQILGQSDIFKFKYTEVETKERFFDIEDEERAKEKV